MTTPRRLTHLSDLTPPSLERTWLTAPHPTLPLVATCSTDKTVRVYSLSNFTLLSTISGGHKRSVRTCAWKPHVQGESVLATGSFDATVGIWRRWDSYGQEDGTVNGVKGDNCADDDDEEEKEDEEEEEWRFAVLLDGHESEVKSVSWSASGMLLATCSRDKSIWLWEDLDDGDNNFETVAVMQEHGGDVKCVAWHPVEECLASASYDDTIRLWREDVDDWGQVGCVKGHEGTVWFLDWEGVDNVPSPPEEGSGDGSRAAEWREQRALAGPRLVSCSDDRTVRVWRRLAKEAGAPGVIRPTGSDETWEEEAVLPRTHELSVYAVAWSKRTGLVASVGADGRIAVYEERFVSTADLRTEWANVATVDGGHGIYEINHVAWARRADRGREGSDEEVLVTTADDGSVKVWTV
jgi:WD40 repeat protein